MLDFDTGLLNFHGTGGFNITKFPKWDSVLFDLVSRPKHEVVIEAVRRAAAGRGGWSKNNPFIQIENRTVEYTMEIEPVYLTQRILSVREQLASEFEKDLNVVLMQGDYILETYTYNVRRQRDDEDGHSREVELKKQLRADEEVPDVDQSEEEEKIISGEQEVVDDELCELDLDDYTNPYKCESVETDITSASSIKKNSEKTTNIATFDRLGTHFLDNNMAFCHHISSPLRKANYDLLTLLATQAAMHELLRKYKAIVEETSSAKAKAIFEYLTDFYALRVRKHFDGDGMHGRAEDFIEELLLSSPKVSGEGNNMTIIDPLALTEQLLAFRRDIATEWKDICLSVPQDHTELRKQILVNQMNNQDKTALEQVFEDSTVLEQIFEDFSGKKQLADVTTAPSMEDEGFQ